MQLWGARCSSIHHDGCPPGWTVWLGQAGGSSTTYPTATHLTLTPTGAARPRRCCSYTFFKVAEEDFDEEAETQGQGAAAAVVAVAATAAPLAVAAGQ